jgi:hypothetical protein
MKVLTRWRGFVIRANNNARFTIQKTALLSVLLSSLLLASCGNRSAENIARIFLQAWYIDHDFDKAIALSTPATHEHIHEWVMLFSHTPRESGLYFETLELEKTDVLQTRASAHYMVDNTRRELLLRKIDGKWLVDMPVDVLSGGRRFSLSLSNPNTGGFASAQSQPARLGSTRPIEESTK